MLSALLLVVLGLIYCAWFFALYKKWAKQQREKKERNKKIQEILFNSIIPGYKMVPSVIYTRARIPLFIANVLFPIEEIEFHLNAMLENGTLNCDKMPKIVCGEIIEFREYFVLK